MLNLFAFSSRLIFFSILHLHRLWQVFVRVHAATDKEKPRIWVERNDDRSEDGVESVGLGTKQCGPLQMHRLHLGFGWARSVRVLRGQGPDSGKAPWFSSCLWYGQNGQTEMSRYKYETVLDEKLVRTVRSIQLRAFCGSALEMPKATRELERYSPGMMGAR